MFTLADLQKRLDDLGVRDIKVFWSLASDTTRLEVETKLVSILNTYLDGNRKPLSFLNDRILTHK